MVALGGDGLMLQTLHRNMRRKTPIFGMNLGTVGFLLNQYRASGLPARIRNARSVTLTPLRMIATNARGQRHEATAINEVSLLRSSRQTARIAVSIDGNDAHCRALLRRRHGGDARGLDRLQPLGPWPDPAARRGPAGTDADQRLPAAALARRAAAAPFEGRVHVLDPRSVRLPPPPIWSTSPNVVKVVVTEATDIELTLLFDPEHDLEERILKEQFAP